MEVLFTYWALQCDGKTLGDSTFSILGVLKDHLIMNCGLNMNRHSVNKQSCGLFLIFYSETNVHDKLNIDMV